MDTNALTSAYGADTLTVDAIVQNPTWLPERVLQNLEGAAIEEALFRNGGTNDGVVAFREAASPYLNDDAENVAEFAEIPVSAADLGRARTIVGVKTALGVRISREMRRENKVDAVSRQVIGLENTMARNSVKSTLAAFESADIPTMAVSAKWTDNDSNPIYDILAAKRSISAAKVAGSTEDYFGYVPNAIVLNEADLDVALWHDSTQRFYRGNAAADNPVYRGVTPDILSGLRVITSRFIAPGDVYVLETGTAGFVSDTDPLTVTPFYSEHGENGFGGANQSWRMDAFRKRIIAVDNPQSVMKITGTGAA